MADRVFKIMGLNGKAVLPMVLGLGCDTMATLTTRILETKKQRLIATLLLALGVPCSAQLAVVIAMTAPLGFHALLFILAVVGSQMLLVGYLAGKLLPGEKSDFIIEIPPMRWPKIENIFMKTIQRTEWFLKEAVPLFLLGTLVLWVLDQLGWLKFLQYLARPLVVHVLSLPQEAANAFIVGFLRRDYGAAGLLHLQQSGSLDTLQAVVSLITITLFVPCLANFFIMAKEHGWKRAFAMVAFIVPFAFAVGGLVNLCLRSLNVTF
jgi:ferrous iron transport protein B